MPNESWRKSGPDAQEPHRFPVRRRWVNRRNGLAADRKRSGGSAEALDVTNLRPNLNSCFLIVSSVRGGALYVDSIGFQRPSDHQPGETTRIRTRAATCHWNPKRYKGKRCARRGHNVLATRKPSE